jgi:hypothetical protein
VSPKEGSSVQGKVEVSAVASPEKADYVVRFERSISGGEWSNIGADNSSPAYTAVDDLGALAVPDGTQLRYRALMSVPGAGEVASETRTVVAGELPQPASVTVAGSLNSEMGCPGDWQPECRTAVMTLDPADRIWRLTADLPAGSYEFKAALNGSWTENYGAGGALNGNNITLNHPGGPVTFRYDNGTHLLSTVYASQQPGAVAAAGDMDSELGCAGDWMPDCGTAQLALDPADLVWKLTTTLPAGSYGFKAALNRSWTENYGAGGAPGGGNVNVTHDGGQITFRYDHASHLIRAD